jgi:small-conductance mechanosensitive channel
METFIEQTISVLKEAAYTLGLIIAGVGIGIIAFSVLSFLYKRFEKRTKQMIFTSARIHLFGPLKWIFPVISLFPFLSFTHIPPVALDYINQVLRVVLIGEVGWLIIRSANIVEDLIMSHYSMEEKDNLQARKIYTQVQFFKRIFMIGVGVLAIAVILMSFKEVRQLGATLLASAGVAGIVLGFAAQRTLSTFIAGLQIAITQPIRIDDVVIVENEWGRIEEITLTYVVVRIWDLRRLVVPITYFTEKSFQNWTRTSADILGTVYLYADYTVSVQQVREELHRLLQQSSYWDGEVWSLQVTNLTDRTVELRALMSARNASDAWSLRCEIRENLLEYIKEHYPALYPRIRAEVVGERREE